MPARVIMSIEDVVKGKLVFNRGTSGKGWNLIYCEVCGDGSRTKGPRGGWLFQDEMCFYHCFNCGVDGNFDPNREMPFSKDMRKIFNAFGIEEQEYYTVVNQAKMKNGDQPAAKPKYIDNPIVPIDIPKHFYPLSLAAPDDMYANMAKEFLTTKWFISPKAYDFFLSTGISKDPNPKVQAIAKTLRTRLIIPIFKNGKMIYFQARDLTGTHSKKYINPEENSRSNLIYNFDALYKDLEMPLYICEGFADAFHLDGVAVFENKISRQQIKIIEKTPRQKVVVPDRKGDSYKLAEQALELGWSISLPDIGDCKDITEAIGRYGKLYVLKSIARNIKTGYEAQVALKLVSSR
jgi:hypothetical protein